jgi:hypothetical protein
MCVICDLASVGGGTSGIFAAKAAPRRASPAKARVQRGAVARPIPEGVRAKGRRTFIKGGTILSMDEPIGDHAPRGSRSTARPDR